MLAGEDRQSRMASPSAPATPNSYRSRAASQVGEPGRPPSSRLSRTSIDENAEGALATKETIPNVQDEGSLDSLQNKLHQISSESLDQETKPTELYDQHERQFQEQQRQRWQLLEKELLDKDKVPTSYYTTSKKEQLVLEFVANFNRQYTQLFPGRKELLLCPPNHFGIKKFVCTTLRPTKLPYRELYDYRGCARFVAEFLSYKPLDPPHELPQTLPGPSYTLRLQQGNSFDYSILLASLLRGVGYDAYVVSGYSTRRITLMDESMVESSTVGILPPFGQSDAVGKAADADTGSGDRDKGTSQGKYKVKPPRQLRSQFLVKQEEKRRTKEEQEAEARRKREAEARAMMEEDDDELKGLRVHAWVLVLPGKREVAESFFIEPSTGRIYSTENENYLGVESVFSSVNYWVNMQVCYDGLKGISFDLGDNAKWEFVLLDNTQPGGVDPQNDDDDKAADNVSDDEENENGDVEILDLPPSWVEKLSVSKEDFESRCPLGAKTVLYKNARHEVFAEYFRTDGMVSRTTFFADESRGFNGEIHEEFRNRRDKLRQRIRVPYDGKIHEFFDPGRPHGLKEHIIIDDRTKEMHFYPSARSDGLVKRVDESSKILEHFTEREDRLVYRSVTFDGEPDEEQIERGSIIKMAEKFDRNPDVPSHKDAAKRTYFLKDDKIGVIYHFEEGKIIPSTREFHKPTAEQKNNFLEMTVSFEVNPYVKPPKKQYLLAELLELLRAEQACLAAVKASDREVKEILLSRQAEEKDVSLVISIYDTIRNQTKLPSEEKKETYKEEEEAKATDIDYLSPFLVNYPNPNHLTREEALLVKDACLKAFKERLIEKANIIQGRLDEVTAEYQRRQLAYSRNADSMTVEETEEYVKFCNDALFKIHILEKRLAKHKETAPERYIELDARLKADPRMQPAFAH
ncbi:uncharacterized protein SPPG_04271 [Spizellomyces punctatus DAOM BR117]|uniref:Dynein regulatory complex subunit 7 n=1 Tax=Spizellomyces punctatus (strain DAOM BR117) TaxID=645134 RepID=A0A0L0HJX1_SPIPD|nr:uncharacterized protein SPPG_04271 [Spizellomyces punctatus DAOM BR117]KND01180.1 hypothetical protein SPPG_04271 [Spizellomyces punctatus DAOM BR117]|eukprot:XP_016609219.1 hypothetical protein SPPG_04271 [Spizellomyces punctatus DAOM BR117]